MGRSSLASLRGGGREYARRRELHGSGSESTGHVLFEDGEKSSLGA